MYKSTKNRKVFFSIVKLILFAAVVLLLYVQLKDFEFKWSELRIANFWHLLLAIVLLVPNMYCVFFMWKRSLQAASIPFERKQLSHSFFAGLLTGLLTPNMAGNFIGRLYYFEAKHRTVITGLTLYSNHAHFVTSLLFGLVALNVVGLHDWMSFIDHLLWPLYILSALGVAIYFLPDLFIPKSWTFWNIQDLRQVLSSNRGLALEFSVYTALRFVIFSFQFLLVLLAFGVSPSWELYMYIWLMYFITLSAPSLFLGKLGVKESIALFVLGTINIPAYIILTSSLFIWLLNTFSPALLGLIFTKNRMQ